jgi:hypothetical protein
MNERIRELYRQANEQAHQQACEKNKTLRPQNNTVWNEFVPLFAELIMEECMFAVENHGGMCGVTSSKKIKEHFGVEECQQHRH